MSDGDSLRAGLVARYRDRVQWLVYADWLAENGFQTRSMAVREFGELLIDGRQFADCFRVLQKSEYNQNSLDERFCLCLMEDMKTVLKADLVCMILSREADILNDDSVIAAMSLTNTTGWRVDTVKFIKWTVTTEHVACNFDFTVVGDQDHGQAGYFTMARGGGSVVLNDDGSVRLTVFGAHAANIYGDTDTNNNVVPLDEEEIYDATDFYEIGDSDGDYYVEIGDQP